MNGELVEIASVNPGDEIRVNGSWLDVIYVERVRPGHVEQVLITCDADEAGQPPRQFVADLLARRRVRRVVATRPNVTLVEAAS